MNDDIEVRTYNSKEHIGAEPARKEKIIIINPNNNKTKKKYIIIITSIIAGLIIVSGIVLLLYFKFWKKKKENEEEPIINYTIDYEQYRNELIFNTKVNDIRRVSINQRSYENMTVDGKQIQMKLFRKTNYDIYIISEKECAPQNRKYCNKTFTASIAMVSQCLSLENENCEPKVLVDLSSNSKTNLRNLNEINDLKDIPIALCLFDLTDSNIITSISCPESLSQSIKDELLSDLYYFRPVAKKSSDKTDEMDITIKNDTKNIRRKTKGLCDIRNGLNSFCDLDMNIEKDSEGNLISFDEISLTNITTDTQNGFNKNKTTKLIDETSKINSLNPDNYKSILNDLLNKLNPYLKYEENLSLDKLISQYASKKLKNKKSMSRYLTQSDKNYLIKEESLFSKEIRGLKIDLNLKYDSGIDVETMKVFSNLKFDDKDNELVNINQFSDMNKAIKKLIALSKTGNILAYQLYEKIKNNLDNLTQEITIKISNLNSLIVYKDLTEIFDSTLSLNTLKVLPMDIIEESNILIRKLNTSLNEIEYNSLSPYTSYLENNINNYSEKSYELMNNTFNNFYSLVMSLNSTKNKFTEISSIYLNNTPSSYINIIQNAKNIISNYGQNENDIMQNKLELILKDFENIYSESISKQKNIVNILYSKLKNESFTIENANEEDYNLITSNLYNSNNYSNIIVTKIQEEIRKILNNKIKENFLSNYDKIKYNKIVNESIEIAYKLDNDEIIDKIFDKIMSSFKENFTSIIKYMDLIKEEKFPLIDDALIEGLFTVSEKNKIKNDIATCSVNIINKIKNEHTNYVKLIEDNINTFLNENLETLNSLILDLNILLSEESLKEYVYYYEKYFNNSLEKIEKEIENNILLIENYYDEYNNIIKDRVSLFDEFGEYNIIKSKKKKTQGYLKKYKIITKKFENIKTYINNQLYNDIIEVYKNIIAKIKENIILIKNNKLTDTYPDISQFEFNNKHIDIINDLNNKLNNYFSFDIFNNNFTTKLNDFKTEINKKIDNFTNYIESQHKDINELEISEDDDDENDICVIFTLEMTILGESFTFDTDDYCAKIESCYNNYNKLNDVTINSNENIQKFQNLSSSISEKENYYNSKINMIKDSISEAKNEIISNNVTTEYLLQFQNIINVILSQKYGDEIIKSSYNYYKSNIETKIENIMDDINNKWNKSFNLLEEEINSNLPNFKNSIEGFSHMAEIFKNIINDEVMIKYFDSIINLQKNEFNNTLSYYYNYLLKIVNSYYLYIINNIPINEMNLNSIIDLRKQEINDEFNKIIKQINNSKYEVLNINNQLNVLQKQESNFFDLNQIVVNKIEIIKNSLNSKIKNIEEIDNHKLSDVYSITSNIYLENSENGRQTKTFSEEINDKTFIDLNQEKFKFLIEQNWIFDKDEIVSELNTLFYNLNKEILNDYSNVKENYTQILEDKINYYFTKDSLIELINNNYKNGLYEFSNSQLSEINENVNQTLILIKSHLFKESERLKNTVTSYTSDFSKINETIQKYKDDIYNKIKNEIYDVVNNFRDNLMNSLYKEYIENGLNNYYIVSKKYTKDFKEYKLLTSSYKLGEIIDNIIGDLVYTYKELAKKQIDYKYQMKLKEIFDFEKLKKFIDEEIDKEYYTNLFPILKEKAIYNQNDFGYNEYDLSDNIKKEIDSNFSTNMNYIKNIILNIKGSNYEGYLTIMKQEIIELGGIQFTREKNINILDFSNINSKLIEIEKNFESFISLEKNYEKNYINENVKKIYKSNFNKSLNNLLSTFGNDFFEKYFTYNQNFKISDLFSNLGYSINQTMSYYLSLNSELIDELPKELKTKLYNLNNIELLIIDNNNKIIELLNKKIEQFIKDTKDYLINYYLLYMEDDAFISMSFTEDVIEILKNNLKSIKNDIENDYNNSINILLNNTFIDTYKNKLNEETDKLSNLINIFRKRFVEEMGDLFTLESENILEEIEHQINMTLGSINEYNSHLLLFDVPVELIQYLNNFGKNNIKPIYNNFTTKIDEISNKQIALNFEKNWKNYENSYNIDKFINEANNTLLTLKDNYIDNIDNNINNYYSNYSKKYQDEYYKFLENYEKNLDDYSNGLISDKSLDDITEKLLRNFENTKVFVDTLKEFDEYNKKIIKNINNLNIAFKESQIIIEKNYYEENNNYNNKLYELKEITMDYYHKINESYYNIKEQLSQSIQNMNNQIKKCINITYENLINEYKKVSEEEETINVEYSKTVEKPNTIYHNYNAEDTTYYIETKMTNLQYYAKFKFGIKFENNDYKNPKVVASIINKSRPNNMVLDIFSYYGNCGQKGIIIDTNFNDAEYTMNLDFDTKSNNINVTTITNFEKYEYNSKAYQIEDSDEIDCYVVAYIKFCLNLQKCRKKIILSNEKLFSNKKEKIEYNIIKN